MDVSSGGLSGFEFFFLFMSVILFFIFIAMIIGKLEQKRLEEIQNYCLKNGLNYSPKANNVTDCVKCLYVLRDKGHTNEWINEMSGSRDGYNFSIFEHYSVAGYGNTKSSHTEIDTICVLSKENLNLPHFYLREENIIFDSIGKVFGGQDVNFSEDSDFSSKFVLQCLNEQQIRKFFDKRIRQAFVCKHTKGYVYEGRFDCFVIALPGKELNLSDRLILLTNAINIFRDLIPSDNEIPS